MTLFSKDVKDIREKKNFERVLENLHEVKKLEDNNPQGDAEDEKSKYIPNFLKTPDKYTGETILHFCVKMGHVYLLMKLLTDFHCYYAFKQRDKHGNQPIHSLARNTMSNIDELNDMFDLLLKYDKRERMV